MNAVTFLGARKYETVTYVWREQHREDACETHLFPEAVSRIFRPSRLLVLVTEAACNFKPNAAEKTYLEVLQERLGELVEPVGIPEGRSERELWEIFDRIASAVPERASILLDVTHAFRSIPMIVFAVAAYLRRVKSVRVERIVYGAYEARDPFRPDPQPEDRAPILDLTPPFGLARLAKRSRIFPPAQRRYPASGPPERDSPTGLANSGGRRLAQAFAVRRQ
jgi:CRISPR-associated DxTHG motif protein